MNDKTITGRTARRLRAIQRKLANEGGSAADWHALGELLLVERRFTEALDAMRKAVDMAPENTRLQNGLALALSWNRRYEEAIRVRSSLEHPGRRDIAALADDMKYAHDFSGAIRVVDDAEARGQAIASAIFVRGLAKLFVARYREGFADLEARFEAGMAKQPEALAARRWDGRRHAGLKLLVCPDQGLGDDIMMCRFLSVASAAGLEPTLLARAPLDRLLRASRIDAHVVSGIRNFSEFDAACAVNSLPHLLDFDGPPPPPLPLSPPAEAMARARAITDAHREAFRIGICWSGNPKYPRNAMRSASPGLFEPLAGMENVVLFSLCKDDVPAALDANGMRGRVVDACSDDADFADTAGLITELDLVISTDTAVVHLAASLGKPVWNLLPAESLWQYGITGDSTPWYPSMRLFRQARRGDWDSVMRQVVPAVTAALQARS